MSDDRDPLLVLSPQVRRVRADNPSPMTLEGTNTWVIGDPARTAPLVVDPGPDDPAHRARILEVCGGGVAMIVLTHRHLDHSEGAQALAEAAGCPVSAVDPALRIDTGEVGGGDRWTVGETETEAEVEAEVVVEVVPTPGHTSDSISLLLTFPREPGRPAQLLTGDTVLGRGTTVITHPDGDLGAYLDSLDRLAGLVPERVVDRILPGHGPVVDDPATVLADYRRHRLERLAQVRAALAAGDRTAAEVVDRVYADIDPRVRYAAEQSVRAQLQYLRAAAADNPDQPPSLSTENPQDLAGQ